MSQISTTQLGVALVSGVTVGGLAIGLLQLQSLLGVFLGIFIGGVTLVVQGQKPSDSHEEDEPNPRKKEMKKKTNVEKVPEPVVELDSPLEEKTKAKKKSKKSSKKESTPKPVPTTQAKPNQAKSPPKSSPPKKDTEEPLTKTQQKKQKKKAAEAQAKVEAAAKKEAEKKREAAAQKKAAKKQAQKATPPPQPKIQQQQPVNLDEISEEEEGEWEKPSVRKTGRPREDREDKKEDKKKPDVVEEVVVPPKVLGAVIGKGGDGRRNLETRSGAKITMPKKDSGKGIIIAGDAKAVEVAKKAIREIEEKGYSELTHPDHTHDLIVLKEDQKIGAIMGEGGKYAREIQKATNTRLNFSKDVEPQTVKILGADSDVQTARQAIEELLTQGYTDITHPGWVTEEFEFPAESMGVLIGSGGSTIKSISINSGVKIETPRKDDPSSRLDVIAIKGTPRDIDIAKKKIQDILLNDQPVPDEILPSVGFTEEVEEPSWD